MHLCCNIDKCFTVIFREEELLQQHQEVQKSLQIKIDCLEQEKENVQGVTR